VSCERAVIVKTQTSTAFGVKEMLGGMAVATLLLGAGAMDLTLAGPKWSFGDCHCGARPTLTATSSYQLARSVPVPLRGALPEPEAPSLVPPAPPSAEVPLAASPLPVAGPDMQGMQVGAEPEARLALQAFPSAAPYASAPQAAPRAQAVNRIFAEARGLEDAGDDLMPARR
jgi:hypothetical protein